MTPLNHRLRRAAGLYARKECPRSELGKLHGGRLHPHPLQLLADSMHDRVPSLVPIKYQRMAASPFGFFRGAACIMAADLAAQSTTGISTQICGDAHVANLGAFAAQDGSLVFDLNDFDETIHAPFEWDVKRFCTSLLLAGREAHLDRDTCQQAVKLFVKSYTTAMQQFSTMPIVELARFQIRRLADLPPIPAIFRIAGRDTPQRLLDRLTKPSGNNPAKRRLRREPPLQQGIPAGEREQVFASLRKYEATLQPERRHFFAQYRPVDIVLRVVGTGSVGLRSYVIYLQGTSRPAGTDPLFLQLKQEPASAYAPYLPKSAPPAGNQGERVVDGQRLMQLVSDPFLGFTTIQGRDFVVRQFHDHKASLNLETVDSATLHGYATLCGEVLARGHARGGDAVAIAAYIGKGDRFTRAVLRFSITYARKTRHDWRTLRKSMKRSDLPQPAPH